MVVVFIIGTLWGIAQLIPPMDYLPLGNRNILFGLIIPPPGYNLDKLSSLGERIEARMRPAWEDTDDKFQAEARVRGGPSPSEQQRHAVPMPFGMPGEVMPPPVDHYFLVAWNGQMFQVAISGEKTSAVDVLPLMSYAAAPDVAPDVLAFGFSYPYSVRAVRRDRRSILI